MVNMHVIAKKTTAKHQLIQSAETLYSKGFRLITNFFVHDIFLSLF